MTVRQDSRYLTSLLPKSVSANLMLAREPPQPKPLRFSGLRPHASNGAMQQFTSSGTASNMREAQIMIQHPNNP